MSSTTTITSIAPSCQNGVVQAESPFETSDELMLEELGRRDGIYSFIFHELESPKVTAKHFEPEIISNHNHTRIGRLSSVCNKAYLKKFEISQQLDAVITTTKAKAKDASITTSTKAAISSLMNMPGEVNIATAASSTSTVTSTARESSSKLPTQNELIHYQQYLKTWYPPPPPTPTVTSSSSSTRQLNFMKSSAGLGSSASPFYLNKRQTNLYVCMMNCGVSVRPQPPRFSHITEPLVRNRRHALKDCEDYKRQGNLHALQAPDLRALFPYDPDVHAPFLTERHGALGCLKAESDTTKSDEHTRTLLATTRSEIK